MKLKILEAKFFYVFQEAIENIHSHTYSLLIDTYVKDKHEKDKIFNAIILYSLYKTKLRLVF